MSLAKTDPLQSAYAEATLAEHVEYQRLLVRERSQWSHALRAYLEVGDEEIVSESLIIPLYELPNFQRALASEFPHWRSIGERGLWSRYSGDIYPAKYRSIRLRPGRKQSFLCDGTRFYQLPGRQRRVVTFNEDCEGEDDQQDYVECSLIGRRDERRQIAREFKSLTRLMRRRHYLRRQAIRATGTLLPKPERLTWDEIALPDATKETIQRNTVGMLALRGAFRQNRVPLRRGVLLYGPPGTGKTTIGKALASANAATFIWVTAADIQKEAASIRGVFGLARLLRPTILFFEDLDFFAGDRAYHGHSSALGELLSQMDGLAKNDGIIVVATTNDLAAVEPAIKDRPSRFDVLVEIGNPAVAARREILAQQLADAQAATALLDRAAQATDGLSGAQVREVAVRLLQEAIFRGAVDEAGTARPSADDLDEAVSKITGRQRRKIGFDAK